MAIPITMQFKETYQNKFYHGWLAAYPGTKGQLDKLG